MSSDIMEVKYFMKSYSNLYTLFSQSYSFTIFALFQKKNLTRNQRGTKGIMDFNLLYLWWDAVTLGLDWSEHMSFLTGQD